MRSARARIAIAAAVLGLASAGGVAAATAEPAPRQEPDPPSADYPWAERVAAAKQFAAQRKGEVGFAIVDEQGTLRGHRAGARFESASVVKVMLMAAYLRQASVRDRDLDDSDRRLLGPMIKKSANAPASAIYQRVGAGALHNLAHDAGMQGFTTSPVWASSLIRPGDQAEFLYEIERFIPERHRDYALGLMAGIVNRQRWGIPPAIPAGWSIHFKGGWAPESGGWKINQVALITSGERRVSLAVLTRGNPSKDYGAATIRGIAERLLRGYG